MLISTMFLLQTKVVVHLRLTKVSVYFRSRNFNTVELPMSLFTSSLGLKPKIDNSLSLQLVSPAGFWTRGCVNGYVKRRNRAYDDAYHADLYPAPAAPVAPAAVAAEPVKRGRGRPRIHATPAAKTAAHRATKARLDVTLPAAMGATVARLATDLDCSQNELLASFVRFALTNRNWSQSGLFGSRGAV